jgi:hypothetical protein
MRHEDPRPIDRWVHEPSSSGVDAELGELFRNLPEESALESAALGAVGRRLTRGRRSTRRPRQLLLAAALLLTGTGAALAQWGKPLLATLAPTAAPSSRLPGSPSRAPRRPVPRAPVPVAAEAPRPSPPPASATSPGALGAEPPRAASAEPRPATSQVTPAAAAEPESALSRESAVLSRALTALRRDHDAATALRVLDEYQAQFPAGVMALEASTARVDALLLLGRRASALQLLGSLPLERSGRRTELLLLRAELNTERDCARALPDFDAVLASSPPGALAERALFGRAGCRLRLGQSAAGQADLQAYAVRFPQGRFAAQVQARLAETP